MLLLCVFLGDWNALQGLFYGYCLVSVLLKSREKKQQNHQFLFHTENLCLYKLLPTIWFHVCYNLGVLSSQSKAVIWIYWSVLSCNPKDSSDPILKSVWSITSMDYGWGLWKANPVQEILPPPFSHQKEIMNFKTPRCQGLNLVSVTFKISLIHCDFQEIALGKAFLWPGFHFSSQHKDSI